jgi:MFS family permease
MTKTWAAPLLATTLTQALTSMVAYSMAVAAPAIAADLGVDGVNVGFYIALVYGVGALSALACPNFIHRYGPIRVSQHTLLMGLLGLLAVVASDNLLWLAASAAVIGSGYGSTTAASSHILIRVTPAAERNLIFSLRQTGVPLGGVLAGLILPPLLLAIGWRGAYLIEAIPCLLLILFLQRLRPRFDGERRPQHPMLAGGLLRPIRLLAEAPSFRAMAVIAFFYSGAQLCFGAFMVVHLTSRAGFSLVEAGVALAIFQVAGTLSRVFWGGVADRLIPARPLLAGLGVGMAAAALLAGLYDEAWPRFGIYGVCGLAGATASGYTGLLVAEMIRLGGPERTAEAGAVTGALMFVGTTVMPALFALIVGLSGSYMAAYGLVALTALASAALVFRQGRPAA